MLVHFINFYNLLNELFPHIEKVYLCVIAFYHIQQLVADVTQLTVWILADDNSTADYYKMDIKAFMQCKKPRRSCRLEGKERTETKSKELLQHPLGYFDMIPIELKFHILHFLNVEELSVLTITSKSMRNLIEGYRVLTPVMQEILAKIHVQNSSHPVPSEKKNDVIRTFQQMGLLMKRSTCLYSTRDRLKFVNEVLTKIMCSNTDKCENLAGCIALSCFGKFLHTVIAGWDDSECLRVFDAVCQHTAIMKNVKIIVNSKPGKHTQIEYQIRAFFRRVFVDHSHTVQDRAFWLSRILKQWPMVHQARLLYVLYGPAVEGEVLWYDVCESSPYNSEQSAAHFNELANALQVLHCYPQEWSEDDVISVLDELTSLPDEWLAENIAHLLILCGDNITSRLLVSKAINGRIRELASITTSFCVVCVKSSFSLTYVMTIVQNIIDTLDSPKDRHSYFNNVMEMFKELILDTHEFSDPDDTHENEMFYLVTAMSEFTKKIINVAYKPLLS